MVIALTEKPVMVAKLLDAYPVSKSILLYDAAPYPTQQADSKYHKHGTGERETCYLKILEVNHKSVGV